MKITISLKTLLSILITLAMVAAAYFIGDALWNHYMNSPWTRDGRVRADVISVAADVSGQVVEVPGAETYQFQVEDFRKQSLLNGWDEIGLTMRHTEKIRAYEASRAQREPWLFS